MIVRMTLLGVALTACAVLGLGLTDTGQAAPAAAPSPAVVLTAEAPRPAAVQPASVAARPSATCESQTWPYVAPECLAQGTAPVRKVSRILR